MFKNSNWVYMYLQSLNTFTSVNKFWIKHTPSRFEDIIDKWLPSTVMYFTISDFVVSQRQIQTSWFWNCSCLVVFSLYKAEQPCTACLYSPLIIHLFELTLSKASSSDTCVTYCNCAKKQCANLNLFADVFYDVETFKTHSWSVFISVCLFILL